MATKKVLTYNIGEVAEMLGMSEGEALKQVKKSVFPFPVIQVGPNSWVVPRKMVDKYLVDGTAQADLTREVQGRRGKPKKWRQGELVNWNLRIPLALAEAFNYVVDQMNKNMAAPITRSEARLLAFKEFIDRRPVGKPE